MKIWVSPDKEKNRYRGGAALKAAGIAVVMMALTVITVALSFFLPASFGISREQILMTGCILTVLLGVWLSVRLGNRVLRDAQIFFTDDDGRLYVLDARLFIQYRRGFPGFARMDRDMRKEKEAVLQQMRKEHLMPAGAAEIVKVDSMRERSRNYSLVCRVKYGHGGTGRRTYLLAKGYEDERGLLWELERRKSWQPALEMRKDHTSAYILISVLLFAVCTGLCILSHPSVAYLPQTIYFPCLGLDFVFIWILVYLVIKRRRGE